MIDLVKGKRLLYIPMVLLGISLVAILVQHCGKGHQVLTGEIDATQIDVSSKVPGRIDTILVREGQPVAKGQVLARLVAPEIMAKYEQARAAVKSAGALLDMAMKGARRQDVKAAFEVYESARAQSEFAEKTFGRFQQLFQDQVISRQSMDEVEFKHRAARAQMLAAKQKWEMALEGARKEEILAAQGNYERACQILQETQAYVDEIEIKSFQAGEIDNILIDPGEILAAGYPVISILDLSDIWAVVYTPETLMSLFQKSREFQVTIPAIGEASYLFTVSFISPLADFATRKATNEQGSFDLKSFEIHLRPVQPIPGLRPGMSARIHLP